MTIDRRSKVALLSVADRGNRRIVEFTLSGNYVRIFSETSLTSPSGLAIDGQFLWV